MSQNNNPPTSLDLFFLMRWQQSGTPIQQRPITNVVGASLVDDPTNNRTIMTIGGAMSAVHCAAGQTQNLGAQQVAYCSPGTGSGTATGAGSCTIDFAGAFGDAQVLRVKIKTTLANQGVIIPNPSGIIEDPGSPGNYANNPIVLFAPSGSWEWSYDAVLGTFGAD